MSNTTNTPEDVFFDSCVKTANAEIAHILEMAPKRSDTTPEKIATLTSAHERFVEKLGDLHALGYCGQDLVGVDVGRADEGQRFRHLSFRRDLPDGGVVSFFMGMPGFWVSAKLSNLVHGDLVVSVHVDNVVITVGEVEAHFRRWRGAMTLEIAPIEEVKERFAVPPGPEVAPPRDPSVTLFPEEEGGDPAWLRQVLRKGRR